MRLSQTAAVLGASISHLVLPEASFSTFGFSFSSKPKGKALSGLKTTRLCPSELDDGTLDVAHTTSSRRSVLLSTVAAVFALPVEPSSAATDCFSDCLKNCKLIAPKDPQYCQSNCQDYCAQEDRTDGLSGSVNSSGGETGILGTTTVVKGEDRPPQVKIPGLDFTSDKGKKLIGY